MLISQTPAMPRRHHSNAMPILSRLRADAPHSKGDGATCSCH